MNFASQENYDYLMTYILPSLAIGHEYCCFWSKNFDSVEVKALQTRKIDKTRKFYGIKSLLGCGTISKSNLIYCL